MVDCDLLELSSISDDDRRRILEYVVEAKGIDLAQFGFDKRYIERALNGGVGINNMLLCSALMHITVDELKGILGFIPTLATEDDLIRVISRAKVDESYRELLLYAVNRAFKGEAAQCPGSIGLAAIGPDLRLKMAILERKIPSKVLGSLMWVTRSVLILISEFVAAAAIAFIIIHEVPGAGPLRDPVNSFLHYLSMIMHGNLGWSRTFGAPVSLIIALAAPWTIIIVSISLTIAFTVGYMLGLISAVRSGGLLDSFINGMASFVQSVPSYVIALVFIIVFGVILKVAPVAGISSFGMSPRSPLYIIDVMWHLALPIVVYAIILMPTWIFITRSLAVINLNEDYVLAARARGVKERRILLSYIGKNSILPQLTMLAYSYGILFGNSIFIESMFAIPGLGYLISTTAGTSDYMTTVGAFLVIIISVIVANFTVDLTYGLIDPRVREML